MLLKNENSINNRRRYDYFPNVLMMVMFGIYAFLSFYEVYINKTLGAYTKYYIFLMLIALFFQYKYIKIRYYHICILAWLALKLCSVLWSWNGFNRIVQSQIFSQFGMVALFCVITIVNFDENSVRKILNIFKWFSFSMAVLTMFFSSSYISGTGKIATDRKVLTLFGTQYDPNNMAAFFLVGITIALYFALCERRHMILNLIVFVLNTFALLQSASRAGFVSLLAMCFLFAISPLNKDEKPKSRFVRIGILIVGAIFIYFVVFKYVFPGALNRLLSSDSYHGGSGRTSIWENALELFYSNPLFGGGWGSYYGYDGVTNAAHNTFVQSLCDTGIVGSILLFIPIIRIFVISIKQKYYFPALFVSSALMPAFFLDSINKRFFWNAIILSTMMLNANMTLAVTKKKEFEKLEKENEAKQKKTTCKYIKQKI